MVVKIQIFHLPDRLHAFDFSWGIYFNGMDYFGITILLKGFCTDESNWTGAFVQPCQAVSLIVYCSEEIVQGQGRLPPVSPASHHQWYFLNPLLLQVPLPLLKE
jgi:hypothetical protein